MDPSALEAVYRDGFVRIRRAVVTIVGDWDEAGDVVQDAFAQAWSRRRRTAATARSRPGCGGSPCGSRRAGPARPGAARARPPSIRRRCRAKPDAELNQAFAALPPGRRLIVVLRYVCGLSYAEIAEVTGLSEGTVAGALSKARKQLVETLEANGVSA